MDTGRTVREVRQETAAKGSLREPAESECMTFRGVRWVQAHCRCSVYNVQDEGRVVVTIVVNPEGAVIRTSINKRTNTVNPALRRAALEAAQKARFNAVDGVDNQSGTITYYFKLK